MEELKSGLLDGDELWLFNSPREFWIGLCGRRGICIVRDGEVVDRVLTEMS